MLFLLSLTAPVRTRLLVLPDADDAAKDLEILVLRQQLRVLRRTAGRPKPPHATESCSPRQPRAPRKRWASSLVTPRRCCAHRDLVRRTWSHRKGRTPGRPPIDPEIAERSLRLARQSPRWAASGSPERSASSASGWAPPRPGPRCDDTASAARSGSPPRRSSSCPAWMAGRPTGR